MIQTSRSTTKIAGTGTSDTFGDVLWSNPSRVTADDSSSATWGAFGGGQQSDTLLATNFGMGIPSNAIIDGIVVSLDGGSSFSAYSFVQVKTNAAFGTDHGGFLNLQPTYGSATDLWGLTLTPADVNHTNFGVAIAVGDVSGGDATATIDSISITVFWHFDVGVPAADVPQRYDYKIYRPDGIYLGNLPNVISPFATTQAMNSVGAQLAIDVGGSPDGQKPTIGLGALNRWLNPAWLYRHKITIPAGKVSADLVDFPVYVNLGNLDSQFWAGVHSTGKDIRITDGYGQSELPFEIVSLDTSAKTGELWFKANAIKNGYDNVFYIYYGNTAAALYAATDPYGRNAVWAAYKGVYHLNETANTTASGYKNATGGTDGTGTSMTDAAVTGKVGAKAADFDGVDDVVTVGSSFSLGNTSASIGVWANIGNLSQNGAFVKIGGANGYGLGQGNTTLENDGSQLIFIFEGIRWITTGHFIPATGWHRYWIVIQASGVPALYADGVLIGTYSGTNATAPTGNTVIGGYTNRYYSDPLDEVHIIAAVPSAAWIAADYANQNSPSTFYSLSHQERGAENDMEAVLLRNGNLVNVYETSYYYPNGKLKFQGQINRLEAQFAPEVDGTIKAICHSDGRDLDNLIARGAPFTYTNDQVQTTGDAGYTVSGGTHAEWERVGQLFTVGAGSNLGRIQVALGGNATVTLSVYTDASLTTFVASVTKNVNVPWATAVDFEFGDLPAWVIGQDYFFTLEVLSGQSILVYYKSGSNPYANGSMYTSSYAGGSGGGSYGVSTNNDLWFTTAYGTPTTTATYTSKDPTTQMLIPVMDDYIARGGNIKYLTADIEATGLSLTAVFNTNTVYEAIDKVLDMSPAGFYYYVDLGTNYLKFKKTTKTPDYLIVKGRHIESLNLAFSIENVINDEKFSGGQTSGVNLYASYVDSTSKGLYGPRLERKSDNRVKIQATADAIGGSRIQEFKDEQYYTTVSVMAGTMNITDIKPGQTVAFRGFGSYIDNMLLQITKVDYTPERATLQLGTLPLFFNSGFEQVVRGLVAEQTVANPSTPS